MQLVVLNNPNFVLTGVLGRLVKDVARFGKFGGHFRHFVALAAISIVRNDNLSHVVLVSSSLDAGIVLFDGWVLGLMVLVSSCDYLAST